MKRIACVLAAVAAVAGLSACGGGSTSSASASSPAVESYLSKWEKELSAKDRGQMCAMFRADRKATVDMFMMGIGFDDEAPAELDAQVAERKIAQVC